jgi:hypothetical protein
LVAIETLSSMSSKRPSMLNIQEESDSTITVQQNQAGESPEALPAMPINRIIYAVREIYPKPLKQISYSEEHIPQDPIQMGRLPTPIPYNTNAYHRIKIHPRPKPLQYNMADNMAALKLAATVVPSNISSSLKRKLNISAATNYISMLHECHQCQVLFSSQQHLDTHTELVHPVKKQTIYKVGLEETTAAFILMNISQH